MQSRSSIFSFDTLVCRPRPTRALLLAIALCAAGRIGLHAARDRLDRIPSPVIQKSFIEREAILVRNALARPKIVLMGDSLTIYGLREEQIAHAAGLPACEVVNLGIEGGRAWDALLLMRRNPQFFTDVRLVLFSVGFHQVQQWSVNKRLAQFYRFSTLDEKVSADSLRDRALMLIDAAWPFYSERRDLPGWLSGERLDDTGAAAASLRPAWEPAHMRQLMAHKDYVRSVPSVADAEPAIQTSVSPLHWRLLQELVEEWRRRGAKVALVTTPSSPKIIQSPEAPSDPRVHFRAYLKSLAGGNVACMGWTSGAEIGLIDDLDYMDAGHLSPRGATRLTSRIIDELDRLGWLASVREPGRPCAQFVAATPAQ